MIAETGAKCGIIVPDDKVEDYLGEPIWCVASDADANYCAE